MIYAVIGLIIVGIIVLAVVLIRKGSDSKPDITEPDITAEYFRKYNWVEQEGSYLVLESPTEFKFYRSKDELDDYYYTGTYEFYSGSKAIDEIIDYVEKNLSDYALTRKEIKKIMARNKEYNVSNFVFFVLNNEAQIVNGENKIKEAVKTPYYGFYLKEGSEEALDIANMHTALYILFTPVDK